MPEGLYLRGVMDILGLSESAINKLVNDGHISYVQTGSSKRVFHKTEIQEFKRNSPIYRSLTKQKVIIYLRCSTRGEERQIRRKAEQYCKQNNLKANIVSELDRGKQEVSQESYSSAINYIFQQIGIAGLLYFGNTSDIFELKKNFQSNQDAFVCNINEINLTEENQIADTNNTNKEMITPQEYFEFNFS